MNDPKAARNGNAKKEARNNKNGRKPKRAMRVAAAEPKDVTVNIDYDGRSIVITTDNPHNGRPDVAKAHAGKRVYWKATNRVGLWAVIFEDETPLGSNSYSGRGDSGSWGRARPLGKNGEKEYKYSVFCQVGDEEAVFVDPHLVISDP